MDIADTPEPPYYAVIFSSLRNEGDGNEDGDDGYESMAGGLHRSSAADPVNSLPVGRRAQPAPRLSRPKMYAGA